MIFYDAVCGINLIAADTTICLLFAYHVCSFTPFGK